MNWSTTAAVIAKTPMTIPAIFRPRAPFAVFFARSISPEKDELIWIMLIIRSFTTDREWNHRVSLLLSSLWDNSYCICTYTYVYIHTYIYIRIQAWASSLRSESHSCDHQFAKLSINLLSNVGKQTLVSYLDDGVYFFIRMWKFGLV